MRVGTFRSELNRAGVDWVTVCPLDQLIPGRGVAVRLSGGRKISLFRLDDGTLCAVGDVEPSVRPISARAVAGACPGEPIVVAAVATFSLIDGRCLTDPTRSVPVYDVRVDAGIVEVAAQAAMTVGGAMPAIVPKHSAA
ncbi:nitrite reductase (NAD(P)H) small subunit [Skermania piniformis]|uniref:Nitrite reductase (NAD(P)H) small subunit n=1 Tax=Skermania pinensis TaxID=39122 RepID=A0ABX8S4V1_9ACTN|nr:nitrite reductase (NAD(P)H) small subunit [Skermania piniformis]QXQ12865.1 nitrite reductase (NAD(P)H) small subunit [Skermania piniformis]